MVEALGKGEQTILIRRYPTTLKEFLLYPTISYTNNEEFLNSFKMAYRDFAEENSLPNSKGKKFEIKYYAKVENVIKKTPESVNDINRFHIWDKKHVNTYIHGKIPYVWVLRIYKINNPEFLTRTGGMRYANVNKEVDIDNLTPVISDKDFNKIFCELK